MAVLHRNGGGCQNEQRLRSSGGLIHYQALLLSEVCDTPHCVSGQAFRSARAVWWGFYNTSSCYVILKNGAHAMYEGVSRSFRTGLLERELRMVQLSATRCSCIGIL